MEKQNFKNTIFISLFLIGVILRLYLMKFPGYKRDIDVTRIWSQTVTQHGIAMFYDYDVYHEYPPGILYLLKLYKPLYSLIYKAGLPKKLTPDFTVFHKSISLTFDLILAGLTGFVVFKLKKKRNLAILGSLAVFLNPSLIYDSVYWGQVDMLLALGVLLSLFLLYLNHVFWAAFVLGITGLTKLQALIIIPWFVIIGFKNNQKNIFKIVAGFLTAGFLIFLPFLLAGNFFQVIKIIWQAKNAFPYFSLNALNLWWLVGGGEPWPLDSKKILFNLSARSLGYIIFIAFYLILIITYLFQKIKRKQKFMVWLWGSGTIGISAFLFLTQMHERYLYLSVFVLTFVYFLVEGKTKLLKTLTILLSITFLFNLAFVMNRVYFKDIIGITFPFILTLKFSYFLSFIQIILGFLYFYAPISSGTILRPTLKNIRSYLYQNRFLLFRKLRPKSKRKKKLKTGKQIMKQEKSYLILILLFAFIIRVWNIWYPRVYVFDEVYHGFTAQEMAKGNVKAWEWWNTPPKGFAYEWTHPPLAKLIMAGGVLFFGKNDQVSQYAFRFPGIIFGLGVIYLTYLLAIEVFKNERIGLLAALLLSFDGLLFVMSRTGMADVYFLFFLLATILLALKERYFWSGIFLGFSLATKWTGIYLYLVISMILRCKLRVFTYKFTGRKTHVNSGYLHIIRLLFAFSVIPTVVYLLSYILFFTSGHTWNQFIELQRQMWWYHTHLEATHNYQSKPWTWPLMLRPVWFWVDYKPDKVGNIYNFGNPIIWWSGLLVLPFAIHRGIKEFIEKKNFWLLFIIFCYFAFWLPWIFSPRIMFLHHYLPAIPFLCILIAWFLEKIKNSKLKIQNWKVNGKLLTTYYLLLTALTFFFFYPLYTGILIPKKLIKYFFWFPSWR